MKYLNQVTAALFVAVTLLMSLASCGGNSDPGIKTIEDMYLQLRNGDVIIQQVENYKDRFTENEYKEAVEKAKENAAEIKKSFDEKWGAYQGIELLDTVTAKGFTNKTMVYYVKINNEKEDFTAYFLIKMGEDGNYTAEESNRMTYTTFMEANGRQPLPDEQ